MEITSDLNNRNSIFWDLLADQDINLGQNVKRALETLEIASFKGMSEIDDATIRKIKEVCEDFNDHDLKVLREAKLKIKKNLTYFNDEFNNRLTLDIRHDPEDMHFIEAYETVNGELLGVGENGSSKKKQTLSFMSQVFLEKLNDEDFKKQLHEKLKKVLQTYVFKFNDPAEIASPNIELANDRLVARVSCPECKGIFTIQTLVRKLNVKWITCNIKRHYKRHYVTESETSTPDQKTTIKYYTRKVNEKPKVEPEDHYEDVTYVDEDYMEQDFSSFIKVNKEESTSENQDQEPITVYLNDDNTETIIEPTTSKLVSDKEEEPPQKKRRVDEDDDEDWLFCRSIWATMKKMNTKTKNKLKIKLLTLTSEMQDDD